MLSVAMFAASCGPLAAETAEYDPIECGVALLIESYNARTYGSPKLADDLDPIIKWYAAKGAELPPEERREDAALALSERYQADSKFRKTIAKSCVKAALTDPVYHQVLQELEKLPSIR